MIRFVLYGYVLLKLIFWLAETFNELNWQFNCWRIDRKVEREVRRRVRHAEKTLAKAKKLAHKQAQEAERKDVRLHALGVKKYPQTKDLLRKARADAQKRWHPDKFNGNAERSISINTAFDSLIADYDRIGA